MKKEKNSMLDQICQLETSNHQFQTSLNIYAPLTDLDAEIEQRKAMKNSLVEQYEQDSGKMKNDLELLNQKYLAALTVFTELEQQVKLFEDTIEINEHGLYQPRFTFDTSEHYRLTLENNYQRQKDLIYRELAVKCDASWTVEGSQAKGRQMTKRYIKLMLYGFNGECDALIAKVKWNNVVKTKERILKAFDTINKLGESHRCYITKEFFELKVDELGLVYELEAKKNDEKEEQKRIREQMKEEERAQKEFERAQREAEDEEKRYERSLNKAKKDLSIASGDELLKLQETIKQLEARLNEAHEKKERAISMAQMTKVGHIYVISNIGSFGENVYKIGMTRRIDPLDRVKELGDASVPFHFDVHAIIYSENAPQLENEIHRHFNNKRINQVNGKKEFFKVTLKEIEEFLHANSNASIQITQIAEAKEYRETVAKLSTAIITVDQPSLTNAFPATLLN